MKPHTALLAMAAMAALDVNRLSGPLPYNPGPALPPQSSDEDKRRIAAAEAKRQRKALKRKSS